MTEAIAQEQEYEVEITPEVDADVEENPLFAKSDIVAGVEYVGGAAFGYAVSDLIGAKIETDNADYFATNPSVWWAIPIVKGIGVVLLLWGSKKVKSPHGKRFMIGMGCGIAADIANDLITAFGVDTSLGITERKIFVQV